MIPYPDISPEIFRIGPFAVRWYGLMYLLGFGASYLLVKHQIRKRQCQVSSVKCQERTTKKSLPLTHYLLPLSYVGSLYTYLILGLLIGARLGYVFFYNLSYYLQHPFEIFALWHGGMASHGGLIGAILAGIIFCRKYRLDFWHTADLVIVTAPLGAAFIRIGNFINGELYGRVTDVPWAMIFPQGGHFPRHPSQLYQFLLEGITLFIILWILKDRGFRSGVLFSLFLILYGLFRLSMEFFREPDPQIGLILGLFTMGQLLSVLMIIAGAVIICSRKRDS